MLEHLNTWPEAVLERFNSGSTVSLRRRFGPVNSGVKPSFRAISNGFREVLRAIWTVFKRFCVYLVNLSVSEDDWAMNDEGRCYRGVKTGKIRC